MANDIVDGFDIADAGDSRFTAHPINSSGFVSGSVDDPNDDRDWFELFVDYDGQLVADLFNFDADLELNLFGVAGDLLASSNNSGTAAEAVIFDVDIGQTYYLEVKRPNADGSKYSLKLDVSPEVSGDDDLIDGNNVGDAPDELPGATIDPNGTVTGSVGYLDDAEDGFSFVAPLDGSFTATASSLRDRVSLQIFAGQTLSQESLILLESASSNGSDVLRVNVNAVAGQSYYVRLMADDTARTSYALDLSLVNLADLNDYVDGQNIGDAGNSASDARPASATSFIQGSVKIASDVVDYYEFVAPIRGVFGTELELREGETEELFIDLFDVDANPVPNSVLGNESYDVQAGETYVLRVGAAPPDVDAVIQAELPPIEYKLGFVLGPYAGREDLVNGSSTGDAGNSQTSAVLIDGETLVLGSAGYNGDSQDFFRFTALSDGLANLSLLGLEADLDLRVFDGESLVTTSTTGGNANENLQFNVTANTQYDVQVDPFGAAASDYELRIEFSRPPVDPEDFLNAQQPLDDIANTADEALLLRPADTVSGSVGIGGDSADVFRFEAETDGVINATVSELSGDLSLYLLGANGERLDASEKPGLEAESLSYTVKAGDSVIVQITADTNISSAYKFRLSAYSEDELLLDGSPMYASDIREAGGDLIPSDLARIFRLYLGGLGRSPDEEGMRYYSNSVLTGTRSLSEVATAFVDSPEFRSIADADHDGEVSDGEFVQHMYLHVFGREPDSAGREYWLDELSSGRQAQADVFENMVHSDEYVLETLTQVSSWESWTTIL